ncbi:MAG: recombinase family protein, partial [Pseudomonadales bacterium]|nr:recombinase family protein [Pseudomonadales bacterium]
MRAALYLRSSKDRSDVSIDAQRRELVTLAHSRNLSVAAEFADAVQSGSTEDRPAFRDLAVAIKNKQRGWAHLLVLDTSRIARGRFIAQAFKRECAKHGVQILYAKLPETDPISTVILESVFEAIDEVHSLMSREKGLAGMAENVRQGFRAGGRAPHGYRLEHTPTGAVRDGKPVTKSQLRLAGGHETVRQYLTARAAGTP